MSKLYMIGIPVIIAILVGCGFPLSNQDDVFKASQSAPLAFVRLSDGSASIFLNVDTDQHSLTSAVKTFPTALSCLIQGEQKKKHPDLRLIDWRQIDNLDELDVCLTHVFFSLGDISVIESWLLFHNARKQYATGPRQRTFGRSTTHWWIWTRDSGAPFQDKNTITNVFTYALRVGVQTLEPNKDFYGVLMEWQTEGL